MPTKPTTKTTPPPLPGFHPCPYAYDPGFLKYPAPDVQFYGEDDPLTVAAAKDLIGWWPQPEGENWGDEYDLIDENKVKVRLVYNRTNRPLEMKKVQVLIQEILRGRWRLNFEPIIIGQTGQLMNGQHQLVALILADQIRLNEPARWAARWPGPLGIAKIVCYGCKETLEVRETMDTCKPRTLADTFFCSDFFADLKGKARKMACKSADHAIRKVWERTGVKKNAMIDFITNAEGAEFLNHHPTLVESVRHIAEENTKKEYWDTYRTTPGYASAYLYLMATSASDGDAYRQNLPFSEDHADVSYKDKAEEFWVLLKSQAPDNPLKAVRECFAEVRAKTTMGQVSKEEATVIYAKAWDLFKDDRPVTLKAVRPRYKKELGVSSLDDTATFGGLDLGHPKAVDDEEKDLSDGPLDDGDVAEEVDLEELDLAEDGDGEEDGGESEVSFEDLDADEVTFEELPDGGGPVTDEGDPTPEELEARAREVRERAEKPKRKPRKPKKEKVKGVGPKGLNLSIDDDDGDED